MAVSLLTNTSITPTVAVNAQTASYTFVLGDGNNTLVTLSNASANTVTIPPNSSVALSSRNCVKLCTDWRWSDNNYSRKRCDYYINGATATAPKTTRTIFSVLVQFRPAANTW